MVTPDSIELTESMKALTLRETSIDHYWESVVFEVDETKFLNAFRARMTSQERT